MYRRLSSLLSLWRQHAGDPASRDNETGNWHQTLDVNGDAFMKEFVMRPEFVGLYPTTDTPTQYVDKLYLHANVAPVTAQDRLDTPGAGTPTVRRTIALPDTTSGWAS